MTRSPAGAVLGAALLVVIAVVLFQLGAERATPRASAVTPLPGASVTPSPSRAVLHPDGPTQVATLVRVTDGDTIVVDVGGTRERVRYIGIDAPEVEHPEATAEPFGDAATVANTQLLATGTLVLERDVSERDRFGRLLRDVWILGADGRYTFVNLELVRDGLATTLTIRPDVKDADLLHEAELVAKRAHLGMWAE